MKDKEYQLKELRRRNLGSKKLDVVEVLDYDPIY